MVYPSLPSGAAVMFDEYTSAIITIILSGLFAMRAVVYILIDLE